MKGSGIVVTFVASFALKGLRSKNCMDKCERRVGHLMTCESFEPLKGVKSLHGCRRISRRFIGMFSFTQSYKSKWFVEQFSMLIEALWCFLLALPDWLDSVCVTLSLSLSSLFLSFSLHSLNASQEFKFKLPHGTCRSVVVRPHNWSIDTWHTAFPHPILTSGTATGAEMGAWQHGMNPVTFCDFTSCEKAGRPFFKSNLFWPWQWNNTSKTSRTSIIWW